MTVEALTWHAAVDPDVAARIAETVREHATLRDAVAWAATLDPPRTPAAIVTQDEYTHDVVIEAESGWYLVYDVT